MWGTHLTSSLAGGEFGGGKKANKCKQTRQKVGANGG